MELGVFPYRLLITRTGLLRTPFRVCNWTLKRAYSRRRYSYKDIQVQMLSSNCWIQKCLGSTPSSGSCSTILRDRLGCALVSRKFFAVKIFSFRGTRETVETKLGTSTLGPTFGASPCFFVSIGFDDANIIYDFAILLERL